MKSIILTSILALQFQIGMAQLNLSTFEFLIGHWQGVESGAAGNGICFRIYNHQLGQKFIFFDHQSSFPPSVKKSNGEVHREKGILSYNSNNSKLILREFHQDGMVFNYELDTSQSTPSNLVFLSSNIENNPGAWKSQLIFRIKSDDQFSEELLISTDGKNFKHFLKLDWNRVY